MSISLNETLKQVEEYKRFAKEPREAYMYENIITLLEELQLRRVFDAKEEERRKSKFNQSINHI